MELLVAIVEAFGIFVSSILGPSKKKINKNISILKKYDWFNKIYENQEYRKLIDENKPTRHLIGTMNISKASKNQDKMDKFKERLLKKLNEQKSLTH
ncbi:hypothetical protein [Alkalihalobacillus sp. BA299]|uniref:hypothetical protein n=1 Tax=Alkalihalobacillus sp. BA299 TaxID=2815938 RepID=UPI001ADA64C6|nr:hypothetical protein [Alkalihalobacillus sp. BA299]